MGDDPPRCAARLERLRWSGRGRAGLRAPLHCFPLAAALRHPQPDAHHPTPCPHPPLWLPSRSPTLFATSAGRVFANLAGAPVDAGDVLAAPEAGARAAGAPGQHDARDARDLVVARAEVKALRAKVRWGPGGRRAGLGERAGRVGCPPRHAVCIGAAASCASTPRARLPATDRRRRWGAASPCPPAPRASTTSCGASGA